MKRYKFYVLIPCYRSVIQNPSMQDLRNIIDSKDVLIPCYRSVIQNELKEKMASLARFVGFNPLLQVSYSKLEHNYE